MNFYYHIVLLFYIKHYDVGATQMMFGNKPLDNDGDGKRLGRIIFDSGSSYTYFKNQAYSAFLSAVSITNYPSLVL